MTEDLWTFDAKMLGVTMELDRTRRELDSVAKYARSRYIGASPGGGWRQFLDEGGQPTVTGTACVVQSLALIHEGRRDYQMDGAGQYLVDVVQADGGWTKPELEGRICLTLTTCLVLGALVSLGGHAQDAIAGGAAWLRRAQNPDGGWGNLPKDQLSDVTCTAYAIRTLTLVGQHHDGVQASVGAAAEWIRRRRLPGGAWGSRTGRSGSLAHTSHAVEGLLAAGAEPSTLDESREWLLREVTDRSNPWLEHYHYSEDYPSDLPVGSRLTWTHLPAERSLIALLKLGVDPMDDIVHSLVADMRARHVDDTYWSVATVPDAAPSWAVLEATSGLILYRDRLEKSGQLSVVRAVIRELTDRLADVTSTASAATDDLAALTDRVAMLERLIAESGETNRRTRRLPGLLRQWEGRS
ncbi:terpene cyclase/mutase family protein [Micromonospora sp. WMMD1120]|uniref:prenyltransferase/squalene oxidase repeat-containing protein n=1 Tax=Micromonospora sp. WMMD1120 TaxID=3016106 RepID=UPI0024174BB7|nr:prenyltransferase/squalene oxidase repeat-containing protein [Micromonospora sp. WMMD1120]MDG4808859.1 terpene cyclase/mutase family protein [Micromonospora sp. WMMD1120]